MKDEKLQNGSRNDREAETNYQFLNQVIREKPDRRHALLRKAAGILLGAGLFGAAAGIAFLAAIRLASAPMGIDVDSAHVSISEEEAAVSVISDNTDDLSGAPLGNPAPEAGASEDTEKTDGAEGIAVQGDQDRIDTLEAYRDLFHDMFRLADESERAIVKVTGITNEMDYFNQSYENRRQISGLVVAVNEESVFILTEYRVVEKVNRILVTFNDGSVADAFLQKRDMDTGLTILTVPVESLQDKTTEAVQTASFGDSGAVERGEPVLALGSPIGYSNSVAYGIVTGAENTVSGTDAQYALLTTDIEGSRDGSGILVDLDGKVIGIIAQQYRGDTHTITALAISRVMPLIEKLSNNEAMPWIGIKGQNVTRELSGQTGIPQGVLVTSVEADSPAMLSGIKEYDVITQINGKPVFRVQDYQEIVEELSPEDNVRVQAMRKGAEGYGEISFRVLCGER